jgi:hypothetical protein
MVAHIRSGNNVFITSNKNDFICEGRREKLQDMGFKVQTPEEFIK